MSATAPDMPACQRKGFVYAIRDTSRATWASIGATILGAGMVLLAGYWTAGCGPNVAVVLLDNGRVIECR